jgi:hypothetical protein
MKKALATLISRVFDPIIEVPLILMGTASLAYLNGFRYRFLTLLFVLDALIPGLMFLYLWGKKKHFKDWDFVKKEERLPLFLTAVIAQGVGVMVAYLIDRHPLAEILLSFWVLAGVFLLITLVWKISVHCGVNATMATVIFWMGGVKYWWVFLIIPVVAWARVSAKKHTLAQAVAGGIVPPILLYSLFFLLGVI